MSFTSTHPTIARLTVLPGAGFARNTIRAELIREIREAVACHQFEGEINEPCLRCGHTLHHGLHLARGFNAAQQLQSVLGDDFPVRMGPHGVITIDGLSLLDEAPEAA